MRRMESVTMGAEGMERCDIIAWSNGPGGGFPPLHKFACQNQLAMVIKAENCSLSPPHVSAAGLLRLGDRLR